MNRTNFPGRKNHRRIEALARIKARLPRRRGPNHTAQELQEMHALERRIVPPAQALNTFSKKWRAAGEPPQGSRAS